MQISPVMTANLGISLVRSHNSRILPVMTANLQMLLVITVKMRIFCQLGLTCEFRQI